MKTQAKKKLNFKKNGIVELNNSTMHSVKGGTSVGIITITSDDPNGSSPICFTVDLLK
ncbi:class I lanthipeptide [Pontimicrobium sp. MEBiC06410]